MCKVKKCAHLLVQCSKNEAHLSQCRNPLPVVFCCVVLRCGQLVPEHGSALVHSLDMLCTAVHCSFRNVQDAVGAPRNCCNQPQHEWSVLFAFISLYQEQKRECAGCWLQCWYLPVGIKGAERMQSLQATGSALFEKFYTAYFVCENKKKRKTEVCPFCSAKQSRKSNGYKFKSTDWA